ncbi:UbiA family prenyltransferase [Nocardioides sp.]|uniref:UbiA family prenyltransferase n=1 Tax=Nocardioides sp. TaxID=35761 RepID=UPI00271EA19D|nr:UbiA family prenyltransferase [Nocardioides sp.]MDO9455141.1 UbiA family prenyltransferase [Nocardioides sp.]
MAKLQRWKRRDPAVEGPVDGPVEGPVDELVHDPADESVGDPDVVADDTVVGVEPEVEPVADEADVLATEPPARRTSRLRLSVADATPVLLLQAAHPRQALVTGAGLGVAALASDRPLREAAVVAATGLVGQAILGWHNDIVDRETDARHRTPRKPVADGRLDPGSAWFALVVAVLLVIPLSISTGVTAGTYFLASLAVGLLGNVALRRGRFSFLSWAGQYALFAAYLSFGGWGGGADGDPPEVAMVVLFALLGVGVHFLRAIWGLVADDADKWTYLPLALGRRLGASRLLLVSATYTGLVLAAIVVVGGTIGLRQ